MACSMPVINPPSSQAASQPVHMAAFAVADWQLGSVGWMIVWLFGVASSLVCVRWLAECGGQNVLCMCAYLYIYICMCLRVLHATHCTGRIFVHFSLLFLHFPVVVIIVVLCLCAV